jgi:prepilin-type N-terminal cleavage/methylation domain-containing protein
MKYINPKQMSDRKAFTLVELLVVISIIALLLAILMPSLQRAREQAKFLICKNNVHQFSIAVAAYAAEYDNYVPPLDPWYNDSFTGSIDVIFEGAKKGLGILYPSYINKFSMFACPGDKYVVDRLKLNEQQQIITPTTGHSNTPTSYLYFGGLKSSSSPFITGSGNRIKITDKPQYGPLAFERCDFSWLDMQTTNYHRSNRLNVLSLRCEVAEIDIPRGLQAWDYLRLMRFIEDEMKNH